MSHPVYTCFRNSPRPINRTGSDPLTDFRARWLKRRGFTQGCAFWGLKYLQLIFNPFLCPKVTFFGKSGLKNFWPKRFTVGDVTGTNDP